MPLYDFECQIGHVFEKSISLSEWSNNMIEVCPKCTKWAKRVYLTPRQSAIARGYEPTLVYISPDGEICVPAYNDPSCVPAEIQNKLLKEGYKEKFLKTYKEYEEFRKSYSSLKREENQFIQEIRKESASELSKNVHHLMKTGFTFINSQGEREKLPPLDEMPPMLRRFTERALAFVDQPPDEEEFKDYYIEAREKDGDKSYRDRQEQTRWI